MAMAGAPVWGGASAIVVSSSIEGVEAGWMALSDAWTGEPWTGESWSHGRVLGMAWSLASWTLGAWSLVSSGLGAWSLDLSGLGASALDLSGLGVWSCASRSLSVDWRSRSSSQSGSGGGARVRRAFGSGDILSVRRAPRRRVGACLRRVRVGGRTETARPPSSAGRGSPKVFAEGDVPEHTLRE